MGRTRNREPRAAARKPIYIETFVRAPFDKLWDLSQNPEQHPRWDLRFSRIIPISIGDDGLTHFRYEFSLPFHTIMGTGVSLGDRFRADGQATSVLKFSTGDPLSPIGPGSGYWRYIPTDRGIRFITGYNYHPGMGMAGRILDHHIFRPALGWATALSFDRLRLWAETGQDPTTAPNRWLLDAAARAAALTAAAVYLQHALAQSGQHGTAGFALAAAAATAAVLLPAHRTVPRAGRCLRRPPARDVARAPSTLATLPAPQNHPARPEGKRTTGS